MMGELQRRIDLYPGDLSIEDVPALFCLEDEPADWSVGDSGGIWATLEYITIGGKTLPREDVLLMIGCKAVVEIETRVSDDLNSTGYAIAAQ